MLLKMGCGEQKSLTLCFPNNIPDVLLRHFIRGYIDGDGCFTFIDKDRKMPTLKINILGTYEFLERLSEIFGSSKPKKTKSKVFKLDISGNTKALAIANWLYRDAAIFLTRKRNIFIKHLESYFDKLENMKYSTIDRLDFINNFNPL